MDKVDPTPMSNGVAKKQGGGATGTNLPVEGTSNVGTSNLMNVAGAAEGTHNNPMDRTFDDSDNERPNDRSPGGRGESNAVPTESAAVRSKPVSASAESSTAESLAGPGGPATDVDDSMPDSVSEQAGNGVLEALRGHEPTDRLLFSVELLDRIEEARSIDQRLDRAVEEALEVTPSERRALVLIRGGVTDIEDLSRELGLPEQATGVLFDALRERGFVIVTETGPSAESETEASAVIALTERGAATVDRSEAIRYRTADLISTRLSDEQVETLSASMSQVADISSARQLPRA